MYPGMVLDLDEGDFWDFRWSSEDQSCAQGSGCRNDNEEGLFRVTLGDSRTIQDVEMFRVVVVGDHVADEASADLAPGWEYLGTSGPLLLGSSGADLITLFDARTGEWSGGGFFSRFNDNEAHVARATSVDSSERFAEWPGFRTGPAISVVRSDSEAMCEIIVGERICPRDQAFSVSELQYYRDGVGPLGYVYQYSASFSGGGFFSSSSSQESVALVASSLRGDDAADSVLSTATPEPPGSDLTLIFGPESGSLRLNSSTNEIPDFKTGVEVAHGVVEVTFANPDVGGPNWSYGVTFRHSEEETFHAVYVSGDGRWGHFAREGSAQSEVSLGQGPVALNRGPGDENHLMVSFGPTSGELYINGEFISELDLSVGEARAAGDVRAMTGVLATDVFNGAQTLFRHLTVRSS